MILISFSGHGDQYYQPRLCLTFCSEDVCVTTWLQMTRQAVQEERGCAGEIPAHNIVVTSLSGHNLVMCDITLWWRCDRNFPWCAAQWVGTFCSNNTIQFDTVDKQIYDNRQISYCETSTPWQPHTSTHTPLHTHTQSQGNQCGWETQQCSHTIWAWLTIMRLNHKSANLMEWLIDSPCDEC